MSELPAEASGFGFYIITDDVFVMRNAKFSVTDDVCDVPKVKWEAPKYFNGFQNAVWEAVKELH